MSTEIISVQWTEITYRAHEKRAVREVPFTGDSMHKYNKLYSVRNNVNVTHVNIYI